MHGRRAEGKGCRSSRCILRRRTSSFTYFPMCIAREGEELLQVVHVHDDVVFAACSSCFDPATAVFVLSSRSLRKLGYETISPSIHIKLDSHRELEFHPHLTQKLGHNPRWGASSMATSFNLRLPPWAHAHGREGVSFHTAEDGRGSGQGGRALFKLLSPSPSSSASAVHSILRWFSKRVGGRGRGRHGHRGQPECTKVE